MFDRLIFLDTEATGNEPGKDRLCQVCYKTGGETKVGYFKPPIPISVKAMSITHITNKMVENAEVFSSSQMKQDLEKLLSQRIMVAHTALFDIAMLKNEGLAVPRFIDTLRVARHLDPDNKIPEHNLQFLRYFLDLEIGGDAHDAEGDVRVLEGLFQRLFNKIRESHDTDDAALQEMVEISNRPTLFKNFIFGKYKGQSIAEVLKTDRRYMEWLYGQMTAKGEAETDEDWIYTLKHYLKIA